MTLARFTYGKGRVRVMRLARGTAQHEPRELSLQVMLEGDFAPSFTSTDNSSVVATDTIKNIVTIVAREQLALDKEAFAAAVAARFLDRYAHVARVTVTAQETRWLRMEVAGKPHDHAFLLDGNGTPFTRLVVDRVESRSVSGIQGFTLMKTTESGWVGYVMDEVTTLPETTDRILATAMDASWLWRTPPADYETTNAAILAAMLEVFANTYSASVQNSLYRMASRALEVVPEIAEISLACPNKHYLPIPLDRFGMSGDNHVFTPTDEPHGQIECTVTR